MSKKANNYEVLQKELIAILDLESIDDLPKIFRTGFPRALKIGIHADLAARYPNADPETIGLWMRRYTGQRKYLMRLAFGTNRHDLDGNDVGAISDDQRALALSTIKAREARAKAHAKGRSTT